VPPGQDIRLALLLILNAVVVSAAFYAARRWTRDALQRLLDVALLWYVVQYISVCVPGILHCLSAISMTIAALICAAVLIVITHRLKPLTLDPVESTHFLPAVLGELFLLTFLVMLLIPQRWLPVTDSDALTYHVPAAVQWMQTGRLGLFPLWFFNPANTYSPLGGSTFIYWLLAPLRSHALFRFVQAPAILLLFAALVQLGRLLGVKPWPAVLCALAAGSRMACSEITAPRDDLLLSAFVVVTMVGFGRSALQDRFAPWRVGMALAMVLATKYTALISLPMILLLWGAARQAGWTSRQRFIAACVTFVLAGPWYLRNMVLTGNPIFPMRIVVMGHTLLPGLFVTMTSARLRSLAGIRRALLGGYHGVPIALLFIFLIGVIAALVRASRRWREPMVRATLLGPLLCLALFFAKAPFGEVRFLYPAFFVMCAAIGLVTIQSNNRPWLGPVLTALFCLPLGFVALYTSYEFTDKVQTALLAGVSVALVGYGIAWLREKVAALHHRLVPGVAMALAAGFGSWIYVRWDTYVDVCYLDEIPIWHNVWPDDGPAWQFVKENIPPTATIAYTQAYLIYPLLGDDLARKVIYLPVRADTPDYLHHPAFPKPIHGEDMGDETAPLLNAPADQSVWRKRLADSHAQYLYIKLDGPDEHPPELTWAEADTKHFTQLFRDKTTAIYQIQS
jgi:hypothetical protein